MRRLTMMVVLAFVLGGCSGQLVSDWAVRAERGLQYGQQNVDAALASLKAARTSLRHDELAEYFAALKKATADGNADDTFWQEAQTRLAAYMQRLEEDRVEIATFRTVDAENRRQIRLAIQGMVKAANAFGERDEIKSRLDQLTAMVQAVVAAQRKE